LNYWKRALKLDPRNATNAYEIGLVYWALRNHAEADRYMDRAIAIEPEVSSWYDFKALNQLAWTGSIQTVRLILEKKPKKAQPEELETEYNIELFERKYASALTRVSSKSVEAFSASPYFTPKGLLIGQLHMLMNQPGLAKRAFDEARRVAEKALKESADDSRIHAALGLAYAGLGRKQEAIRNGKRAVELLPISRDAWQAPVHREELARTYIMIREYDAALDQIEYLLSIPSWVTVPLLRIDPAYDPLRNHPRFQELLQKYDHAGT
jgi:serine/threonine-protein kinase